MPRNSSASPASRLAVSSPPPSRACEDHGVEVLRRGWTPPTVTSQPPRLAAVKPVTWESSCTVPSGSRAAKVSIRLRMPSRGATNMLYRAPLVPCVSARRWPNLLPHGANQTAVLPFHLQETRHGRAQTELFGITRVDPTDQGLDQAFVRLPAEPPDHKGRQTLVLPFHVFGLWDEVLPDHPQFP